jgi:hypothetical protein
VGGGLPGSLLCAQVRLAGDRRETEPEGMTLAASVHENEGVGLAAAA